jgi:hypothetical protein
VPGNVHGDRQEDVHVEVLVVMNKIRTESMLLLAVVAVGTGAFGCFVAAQGVREDGVTSGTTVLALLAVASVAGAVLFLWAGLRRPGWAALGLALVAPAPTGFAYLGNVVVAVAALALAMRAVARGLSS